MASATSLGRVSLPLGFTRKRAVKAEFWLVKPSDGEELWRDRKMWAKPELHLDPKEARNAAILQAAERQIEKMTGTFLREESRIVAGLAVRNLPPAGRAAEALESAPPVNLGPLADHGRCGLGQNDHRVGRPEQTAFHPARQSVSKPAPPDAALDALVHPEAPDVEHEGRAEPPAERPGHRGRDVAPGMEESEPVLPGESTDPDQSPSPVPDRGQEGGALVVADGGPRNAVRRESTAGAGQGRRRRDEVVRLLPRQESHRNPLCAQPFEVGQDL